MELLLQKYVMGFNRLSKFYPFRPCRFSSYRIETSSLHAQLIPKIQGKNFTCRTIIHSPKVFEVYWWVIVYSQWHVLDMSKALLNLFFVNIEVKMRCWGDFLHVSFDVFYYIINWNIKGTVSPLICPWYVDRVLGHSYTNFLADIGKLSLNMRSVDTIMRVICVNAYNY